MKFKTKQRSNTVESKRVCSPVNVAGRVSILLSALALSSSGFAELYEYDDLGRLTKTTLDDGTQIIFEYDPAGNRKVAEMIPGQASNDPPVGTNDAVSTNEDIAHTFDPRVNDSDPNGDPITIIGSTNGANGSVAIIGGGTQLRYTPNANWSGSDSFTYTISDGAASGSASVGVTVSAVNDAPNAVNDSISTNEDTQHTFNPRANDNDVETSSSALVITARTNGAKGSVSIINSGTQLRYTPNANANGSDSFTYTIRDANNATDTATVSVSISAVNDAPNAVNDSRSTNEDSQTTFDPRGNDSDPDGQTLTITARTQGSKGSVSIVNSGTQLRYTPNANASGTDSFTYTVSDGSATDTATVSMTVNPINDPPNAVNDSYSNIARNVWVTLNVLSNDVDPEGGFTVTAVGNPPAGDAQIINGGSQIRYRNTSGLQSSDFFNYTISDSGGLSDTASVSVTFSGGGFPLF